jgi:hypothetical protein
VRRETISEGGATDFRGRFYGCRVDPAVNGVPMTVRADRGMTEEFLVAGFFPLTVADQPASRVEVAGGGTVALAETMLEAMLLVATPSPPLKVTRILYAHTYAFGASVRPDTAMLSVPGVDQIHVVLKRPGWSGNLALVLSGLMPDGTELDFCGSATSTTVDPTSRLFVERELAAADFSLGNLTLYKGVIPESFRVRASAIPTVASTLYLVAYRTQG